MQVHDEGFRAEFACVVALAHQHGTSEERLAQLQEIAAHYRVRLVPLAQLEEAASEHGTPLPDTLRPPAPRAMPEADPAPAAKAAEHAADATIEQVGTPRPKVGFDGRALPKQPFEGFQGI